MRAVKLTSLFILISLPLSAAGTDDTAYKALLKQSRSLSSSAIIAEARSFLAEFPESEHVPDIRLLIADNEYSPDKALAQYRAVRDKYRFAARRDYAALRTVQILLLSSRFADCADEGISALDVFPDSRYSEDIALTVLRTYYCMQQYENAAAFLKKYPLKNTAAETISTDIPLKLSEQTSSGAWIAALSKTAYPESALYRAGREFEADNKKNEAFSAYTDCIRKYPRSAEALLSEKRAGILKKAGAQYMKTYASAGTSGSAALRLSPDRDVETGNSGPVYAVLIGPFYNLKEAKALKKEMTVEFSHAVIVKQSKEFVIYAGRTQDQEEAVALKVRLAEEFGLNGTIVNLEEEDNREYIYGQ